MIRKATKEDIPAILDLINENPKTVVPRDSLEVEALLNTFWVAEQDGAVVGCSCLEVYSQKIAELRTVIVKKTIQNKGIGKLLVKAAVEEAERRKIKEVITITSSPSYFENLEFGSVLNEKYALFWKGTKPQR